MIYHSKPFIDQEDARAVSFVVQSGRLAQGAVVKEFEDSVASYVGVKGGAAVSSGTAALHLALISLDVQAGDEVILPSYVCVAPLNAINYVGATPVVCDVDPLTGNIDPDAARSLITEKTKAIIVPHMFGHPVQMERFRDFGVPIIEDCAQAIGATINGKHVGSFGDVAICSFYATKVITTGEGGMVLSDNEAILEKIKDLRDYDEKSPYKTRYNYKMTDMQATMGLTQLRKLLKIIDTRRLIADFYDHTLAGLPVTLPPKQVGYESIYFRYVIRLESAIEEFMKEMEKREIICRHPVYKSLHQLLNLNHEGFSQTEQLCANAVSIPIYPMLSSQDREQVADVIKDILSE